MARRKPDLAPSPPQPEHVTLDDVPVEPERDLIRRIAGKLAAYFEALPPGRIDQKAGTYYPGCAACVGAHLAHRLSGGTDFEDGLDDLATALTTTRAHVILLLRSAGAPADPFDETPWATSPAAVFRQLAATDTGLPGLRGADLSNLDLSHIDLSHRDLRGADLYGAELEHADLSFADLQGASLIAANCIHANFVHTDLRGCRLDGCHLDGADLRGADLDRAGVAVAITDVFTRTGRFPS